MFKANQTQNGARIDPNRGVESSGQADRVVETLSLYDRTSLPGELKNEFIKIFGVFLDQHCGIQAKFMFTHHPIAEYNNDPRNLKDDLRDILINDLVFDGHWPQSFRHFLQQGAAKCRPAEALKAFIRWRSSFLSCLHYIGNEKTRTMVAS